jgi:hypothetical protein
MKFLFEITEVNQEFLIKYPCAALDGELTIDVNHSLFFDREGISLLELAIYITGWLSEVNAGIYSDFDYSADDYEENPVLHFTKVDNLHYTISSAWVKSNAENTLSLSEIIHCFNEFLRELDTTLQQLYGVGFDEIPLSKLVTKPKASAINSEERFSLKGMLKRLWS